MRLFKAFRFSFVQTSVLLFTVSASSPQVCGRISTQEFIESILVGIVGSMTKQLEF